MPERPKIGLSLAGDFVVTGLDLGKSRLSDRVLASVRWGQIFGDSPEELNHVGLLADS